MTDSKQEGDEPELNPEIAAERRTLKIVLWINLAQFAVAFGVGLFAQSSGLLGAALDNLGDAAVYMVSLYAVGRSVKAKAAAARLSGVLLVVLAFLLALEVMRRFYGGAEPIGIAMILTALLNAATNVVNLRLLRKHRDEGVNLKASWIFTTNDMAANLGIAISGAAVMVFGSAWPDLIIGLLVAVVVIKGGFEILREARAAGQAAGASQ